MEAARSIPGRSGPSRAAWAALVGVAAVVVGLLVAWTAYGLGHLPDSTPRVVAGWVLVGSGLVGWVRAPWSRVGPLLAIAGFAWFVGDLRACLSIEPLSHRCLDLGAVRAAANALGWVWLGVLVHAAASLPDGRVHGWIRGTTVAGGYAIGLAIPAWSGAPSIPDLILALGATVAAIGVLLALLAADARRAALTPDRAVGLGGALAQALRDPDLRIAFHDPGRDRWLDPAGRPMTPPVPLPGQVETRIERDGVAAAIVAHDPATLADPAVRNAVVLALELAARNAQLRGDLDAQAEAIAASRRRLLSAAVAERQALAAEVDREVERPLATLAADLGAVAPAVDHLTGTRQELELARAEIHDLASGLFPARLVTDGIPGALADLAARAPDPVSVMVAGAPRPDPGIEAAVVFLCAEALTNAARHAPGASVRLEVRLSATEVQVTVADEGPGGADDRGTGSGLRGLRDRIEALGGELTISSPPGAGTRLEATIPVPGEARPRT